jgi:hypothetical protein
MTAKPLDQKRQQFVAMAEQAFEPMNWPAG